MVFSDQSNLNLLSEVGEGSSARVWSHVD